jgi:hypothetical protein
LRFLPGGGEEKLLFISSCATSQTALRIAPSFWAVILPVKRRTIPQWAVTKRLGNIPVEKSDCASGMAEW